MRLKKILAFSCITVLSVGLFGCGTTDGATSGTNKSNWKVSKTIDIVQTNNIGGFYNDNFGITVGYNGEIHYTTDGGATWPKGKNVSFCRFGLDIVSEKIAWCCGNGGHVRKTIDGEQNWEAVTNFGKSEPDQCRNISFLNESIGWNASPDALGSTKDGGTTWAQIKLPSGIGKILSMNLLNENTGYLVDTNSKLYTTNDGGSTWKSNDINTVDIDASIWTTNSALLRFTDENNGTFFYYSNDTKLKCVNTKDGGKTWSDEILPEISGNGLYLSHDGKILSINSDMGKKITLLKSK